MNDRILKYKGKKLMFLFDTNIYRNIARMVEKKQIMGNRVIIDEMKRRESENGYKSIMSLTTTLELLKHLNEDADERKYEECYDALRFQFLHTQILQPPKRIPLIDSLLTFFFYGNDTKDKRIIVSEFIFETVMKIFYQNIELSALKNEIQSISDDFLCDKKIFFDLFNLLLKRPDNIKDNGSL